jgi:peptide/nickel transport system substrate-binding protein
MQSNYWSQVLARRIGRRRALLASGSAVLGAAFLAACGGDDGDDPDSESKPSVLTEPKDTSQEAKRGGRLVTVQGTDYFSFDPTVLTGGLTAEDVFSRLIRLKPGHLEPVTYSFTGDVFDSWEFSPDKLSLTGKVRQGFTWHNVPPVGGRQIDAEDVVQAVKRYAAVGPNRASYFTEVNPDSPITSWSATDNRTVVFKLKQPSAGLLGVMATQGAGLYLTPKEADSGYDPRSVAIGSGNWQVAEWQPSARLMLKRHEGHYEKARLYIDERHQTILP